MAKDDAPAAGERARLANELLHVVEVRLHLLTSRPGLLSRQIAAAGLARCCALNEGIRTLCRGDRGDVAGLAGRALYETVIISLYVLLKGHQGVMKVVGDHKKHTRILIQGNTELNPALIAGWSFDEEKINLEQIAKEVSLLLNEAGDPIVGDFKAIYDLGYRVESTFSAHGYGAIGRYLDASTAIWHVVPNPGALVSPAEAHVVPALYTAALARHVFLTFGVGVTELRYLTGRLLALFPNTQLETPSQQQS